MKIILLIIAALILMQLPLAAYIREPDIANSRDSFGAGYASGIMLFGEKILADKKSSFGTFFIPSLNYGHSNYISSFWEMSYTRQLTSADSQNQISGVLGIAGYLEKSSADDSEKGDYKIMPEIGLIFGFKPAERVSVRARLVVGPMFGVEVGYMFLDNIEVSAAVGLPLIGVKFIHEFGGSFSN